MFRGRGLFGNRLTMTTLPVKGGNGRWLTPCSAARARQLIKNGVAVKRENADGTTYLQLTVPLSQLAGNAAPEGARA